VPRKSTGVYRFGDLLALARQSWITQMASGLSDLGFDDYRRSDAATMRHLRRGPMSIGRLGVALGVSRQAARKVVGALEQRGFATLQRDSDDTRQVNVVLTADGEAYSDAVTRVVDRLNRSLSRRVNESDLVGADTVLRAVLLDDHTKRLAERIAPPSAPARTLQGRSSSD
jgi:DNA-binding MarR family transcriptional regulator